MRVLWVATKAPWPVVDGGRLLLWNTLRALHAEGVDVTLVTPYLGPRDLGGGRDTQAGCERRLERICRPILVPSRLGSSLFGKLLDLGKAEFRRRPWTVERHDNLRVRRRVLGELAGGSYDVVVVEQVQALAQVPWRLPSGVGVPPVVLRAQNVESDLWRALASSPGSPGLVRWWLRRQADRLAGYEARSVRRCRMTVALTDHDADVLRRLAHLTPAGEAAREARVEVIPAPIDVELPAGPELAGQPAVVLFGSSGWAPNADGARSFVADCWPEVQRRNPRAVLHLFGDLVLDKSADVERGDVEHGEIRRHAAPDDSATALASGSVLVVPLAVASGVRMKILEAWARGVAVVATTAAASGLVAQGGRELQIADRPAEWADAISRLVAGYDDQAAAARRRLEASYAPAVVSRPWLRTFEELSTVGESYRRSA